MALPRVMESADLLKFRTRVCQRWTKGHKCNFGDKCQYSHDTEWPRRPLWEVNYCETLCTYAVDSIDKCPLARNCPFAHTETEALYHPSVYKTELCREFNRSGKCSRYYCPYAHGISELKGHAKSQDESPTAAPSTTTSSIIDDTNIIYVSRDMLSPTAVPPPTSPASLAPSIERILHPTCSPQVLNHLYELFDDPSRECGGGGFPLIAAWRMIESANRVLHLAELNHNVNVDLWQQFCNNGNSILAFIAPERVSYWNNYIVATQNGGRADLMTPPDDMKALTWSAFLLLYISQYGVHPFAGSATCALHMCLQGRPDLALSERNMAQVFEAYYASGCAAVEAPQLSRGLEIDPSVRPTWRELVPQKEPLTTATTTCSWSDATPDLEFEFNLDDFSTTR